MVTPVPGAAGDLTKSAELFDVNLNGVMNALAPVAPRMRRRRAGQIFGSIAGFAPPPDSPSYAASKAAIVAFALATRALYHADGVSVSVVCPAHEERLREREAVPDERRRRNLPHPPRARSEKVAFPWPLYLAARLLQWPPNSPRRAMLTFRATARPPSQSDRS